MEVTCPRSLDCSRSDCADPGTPQLRAEGKAGTNRDWRSSLWLDADFILPDNFNLNHNFDLTNGFDFTDFPGNFDHSANYACRNERHVSSC